MDSPTKRAGRLVIVLLGTAIIAFVAWLLFVEGPDGNLATLFGILLVVIAALLGVRFASNVAERFFAPYNVAEVPVEGPITRRDGGRVPSRPNVTSADEVVDQIERANSDGNVEGLVVRLNTPGGEVVPSEDIRIAAEEFDGPTVAYAVDTCASGGYWIASGCDTVIGREGTIVGSIGVLASRITAEDLLDTIGLTYERLVAGEYKDTGVPFRDMDSDDRTYLQEIVDEYYDVFIDRVAEGRDLDADTIRETEARVFLGEEALELGLLDSIGTMDDVEAYLESELSKPVDVRTFEPSRGLRIRLRDVAATTAYALGSGITQALFERDESAGANLRLR